MIGALIIDDERHCRESLQILVEKYCPEVEILSVCEDGKQALSAIEQYQPQLVFLDIAMPEMSGFQMLSKVQNINFKIIFTTAYDAYALKAFEVNAVDYLLKPIDRASLIKAVQRVIDWYDLAQTPPPDHSLIKWLKSFHPQGPGDQIAIPTSEGLELLDVHSILYCKGDGNYTHIYLGDGTNRFISKPLKYLEEKLASFPEFFRIHHSTVINLTKTQKYIKGMGGYVIMTDGEMLSVSRQKKQELLGKLT